MSNRTVTGDMIGIVLASGFVVGLPPVGTARAQTRAPAAPRSIEEVAKALGLQTIRGVDYDVCYPSDASEYEALGRNAVVMLTASSAISTELPLRTAYLLVRGVRVPLRRVAVTAPRAAGERTTQSSFYLLPLRYMKVDARLMADFAGARRGFGVTVFSAGGVPKGMPAFARLNEYDEPGDPEDGVVLSVIEREYPDAGAVAD